MSTESAAATEGNEQESQTAASDQVTDDVIATGDQAAASDQVTDDVIATDENLDTDAKADDVDDEKAASDEKTSKESEQAAADAAPESYADFKLPEGIEMNPGYMEKLGPVFKELNLSQPQAQRLIDAHVGHVQATAGDGSKAFERMKSDWLQEAKTDTEIGGDKFQQTAKNANLAVNQLGTPALKELFKSYGIGQHPEVIRVFSKIGGFLGEDSPGNFNINASPEKKDTASSMYPDD